MVQDSIINILNFKILNLDSLGTELRKSDADINYKKGSDYYLLGIGFPEFISNDHTLETLKASGNIEAISNKVLRKDLLNYYDDVEVYYRTQTAANDIGLNLLLHNHVFDLMAFREEKYFSQDWFTSLTQKDINEFTNQIAVYFFTLYDLRGRLEKLNKNARKINDEILKSIEGSKD